ncbi:MAG: hypothetical protein KF858_15535, partial [Candidatus Sumerlaeia bacterium]|nr:hypothetical protein [Candidatus Sumerlaeia bacterium]
HFGRLVVRTFAPNRDAYENEPYFDSTTDTQNFVAPSSGLQVHTLHDESDEDWGVAVCWSRSADGEIAQIPYELAFTNVSAPAGAGFMVEIFRDGRPDPGDWGATCDDSEAFDCRLFNAPGSMTWVTPGVEEIERVWWRVKWTGPPPPEGQAIGYTVELRRSTGASNGIIGSIGSDQDKSSGTRSAVVRFGLDNRLDVGGGIMYGVGELDAMRLKRSVWTMFGEPVSEMQIGPDFLPSPHCTNCSAPLLECGVERRLSPAATTCYQLLDNQLGAVPGIGVGWIVAYSVTAVVGGIELAQDWASDYYVLGAACPLAIPDCVPAANPPSIGLSPTSITRTVTQGQSPADTTVTLSNIGGGTLDYSVQSPAWASVSPSSGNVANNAELTLSFATGGLVPGVHTGSLVFTSTNADNSPQEVALSVTVTALPRLAVDPMEVSVGAEVGASPAPVGIVVSNTGGGALDFGATVRGSVAWLALEEAAGSLAGGAEQTVTLVFATESLEPGTHTATIDITAPGALGAPVALPVEVIITGSTALPGDVTGDGQVTPADANLAFRCWFEGTCPPGADALAADLCADGQLTPADAQAIFETWLGLDLSCP